MSRFRAFFMFLGVLALGAVMFYLGRIGFIEHSKPISQQTSNEDLSDEDLKNVKYLVDAIDPEKGEIAPGDPENEWQRTVATGADELKKIISEMNERLSTIGQHEFQAYGELGDKQNVIALRENLRRYWKAKKDFYDQTHQLVVESRKKIGTGKKESTGFSQILERLERKYVETLTAFYDFVIQNHHRMSFEQDQVFLETDDMVQRFNALVEEMNKASEELTSTYSQGSELVLGGLKAVKEEMRERD